MDVNYTADPYIKIYAFDSIKKGSDSKKLVKLAKTNVVKNSRNPYFNFNFVM